MSRGSAPHLQMDHLLGSKTACMIKNELRQLGLWMGHMLRQTRQLLRGSLYETSPSAGSYRGELLGLVALHTLIVAVAQHFKLETVSGKIWCNNISALGKSSKTWKQVSPGTKHLDLHRSFWTLKCILRLDMAYVKLSLSSEALSPHERASPLLQQRNGR